jgi:hypothetical protein
MRFLNSISSGRKEKIGNGCTTKHIKRFFRDSSLRKDREKKEKRGEGIIPAVLCFYFDEELQDGPIFDISGCQRISFIEDDILL